MVRINVAYYSASQLPLVEAVASSNSMYVPWDISFNYGNPLVEYGLFRSLVDHWDDRFDYEGIYSWKFAKKSGVDLGYLHQEIKYGIQTGYDAIILNPAIANNALFENMWSQAIAVGHPNFDQLLIKIGMENLRRELLPVNTFSASSYIIGNYRFWVGFLQFVDDSLDEFESLAEMDSEFEELYFGSAGYHRDIEMDYRPFIIERLLQLFLFNYDNYHFIAPTPEWFESKFGIDGSNLSTLYELKKNVGSGVTSAREWKEFRDLYYPIGSEAFFDVLKLDDPEIQLC